VATANLSGANLTSALSNPASTLRGARSWITETCKSSNDSLLNNFEALMLAAVRLCHWDFAVFFAVSPVILGIADSPAHVLRLFDYDSYTEAGRDLIFAAIAVLAIGLIDAFEVVSASLLQGTSKGRAPRLRAGFILILTLGIVIQLLLYASWSHGAETEKFTDISTIIRLVVIATISALFARLTLVAGE
jgi:hypothetical protein